MLRMAPFFRHTVLQVEPMQTAPKNPRSVFPPLTTRATQGLSAGMMRSVTCGVERGRAWSAK